MYIYIKKKFFFFRERKKRKEERECYLKTLKYWKRGGGRGGNEELIRKRIRGRVYYFIDNANLSRTKTVCRDTRKSILPPIRQVTANYQTRKQIKGPNENMAIKRCTRQGA